MSLMFWFGIIALSGSLAILFSYLRQRKLFMIFKPLTTLIIILLAFVSTGNESYQMLILVGLVLSLAGDVFLLFEHSQFVFGLVSFLMAHIAYTAAFLQNSTLDGAYLLPLGLYGAVVMLYLFPKLGKYRLPVLVYMLAILAMGWAALSREWTPAGVGACFFIASDTLLALNRFDRPFRSAQFWVLSTYWIAQTLIALSIEGL